MKAIDLRKPLKEYSSGWIALDDKKRVVVAHARTFAAIVEKAKKIKQNKNVVLLPAAKSYFGFVT